MRKIFSFMHMSLDGFVASTDKQLNWVKVDEELFDFIGQRIAGTDTALYGRITYEMMEGYWPTAGDEPDASKHDREHSQWYKNAHKIVLSNTLNEKDLTNTTIVNGNLADRFQALKQQPGSDILLFGSPTATHALIEHNLIDGYWLFVNPIILGQGIPLFAHIKERTKLKLQSTRQFSSGVVELNYNVDK